MASAKGKLCNDYDGNPVHDRVRSLLVLIGMNHPDLDVASRIRMARKAVPMIDTLLRVPLTVDMVHRYTETYKPEKSPLDDLIIRSIDHLNMEIEKRRG